MSTLRSPLRPADYPDYPYDDALVEEVRKTREGKVDVYRVPEPLIVLGRGSKVEIETDQEACRADAIRVTRRRGGGCAVFLDPGNVIVSVCLPISGIIDNRRHLRNISEWLIDALIRLGGKGIVQAGICDLVQHGRKFCGACLFRSREILLYSASILVDMDITSIDRYLLHPPREPGYRAGRSHGDFLTALVIPALTTCPAHITGIAGVDGITNRAERLAYLLRIPGMLELPRLPG